MYIYIHILVVCNGSRQAQGETYQGKERAMTDRVEELIDVILGEREQLAIVRVASIAQMPQGQSSPTRMQNTAAAAVPQCPNSEPD